MLDNKSNECCYSRRSYSVKGSILKIWFFVLPPVDVKHQERKRIGKHKYVSQDRTDCEYAMIGTNKVIEICKELLSSQWLGKVYHFECSGTIKEIAYDTSNNIVERVKK